MPPIVPQKAAAAAMAAYDHNGDGRLDAAELAHSPGLQEILKTIKQQNPRAADALTVDDIAGRFERLARDPARVMDASYRVLLDNRPLADATVTFEPNCSWARSTNPIARDRQDGFVQIMGPVPKLPGLYVGVYRVKVSKLVDGRETIRPATTCRPFWDARLPCAWAALAATGRSC